MNIYIKHTGKSDDSGKPLFVVESPNKCCSDVIALTLPRMIPVGNHNTNLQQDLRWYLESYLELPIEPYATHANDVQETLKQWGRECFDALFIEQTKEWLDEVEKYGLDNLVIKIISDSPEVLAWPWEALNYTDRYIAEYCQMERQLDKSISEVSPLKSMPPVDDRLNILYIISRPAGINDVGYQTIARPLVDFVADGNWAVTIDVLRPATFERLQQVLRNRPNHYHIVHFDGHGCETYQDNEDNIYTGGLLAFESADEDFDYEDDLIPATEFGCLMKEFNIPYVVLNACQSATFEETAENPFASVATRLLQAGIQGIVAMSYNLWISGAEVFVPAFYASLFQKGDISEAVKSGRKAMLDVKKRDTFMGKTDLHDWIIPVLYTQNAGIQPLPKIDKSTVEAESILPLEVTQLRRANFIGRSTSILLLEHAIQMKETAILIHGMAGEGKTTLAQGFLQWLESTGGLVNAPIWFSFERIHSASYVIDTLTNKLLGIQAMALPLEKKLLAIVKALKSTPIVMVWDNFESVSGYGSVKGLLSKDERNRLKSLLRDLRGGATKVLITSRSPEDWLDAMECFRLKLDGLRGAELWQYCNAVVRDLGLTIAHDDIEYTELIDKLQGNPLSIRVILLQLEKYSASRLLSELNSGNFQMYNETAETKQLLQMLIMFDNEFNKAFVHVLRFIGLHELFVSANMVTQMLIHIGENADNVMVCFNMLERAGLCRKIILKANPESYPEFIIENNYKIHPILRTSLIFHYPASEIERQEFINAYVSICSIYGNKRLHEQQLVFEINCMNFYNALNIAIEMQKHDYTTSFLSNLTAYAKNAYRLDEAESLCYNYVLASVEFGDPKSQILAFNLLGTIKHELHNLDAAEECYEQSLIVSIQQNDESNKAIAYFHLGKLARERRDFEKAEQMYMFSFSIALENDDWILLAENCLSLGTLSMHRDDFDSAEKRYKQALELWLDLKSDYKQAMTYNQLGNLAYKTNDLDAALSWYKQALDIWQNRNDEREMIVTYNNLAIIDLARENFEKAENWYRQSMMLALKLGDEYMTAYAYNNLGVIALERGELDVAEDFIKIALELFIKHRDQHQMEIASNALHHIQTMRKENNS